MFVHADRRREADGEFHEPGLWLRQQSCPGDAEKISGGGVDIGSPKQQIVIAASGPLTDDGLGSYSGRIIGGPERRRDHHDQRELVGKNPAA
jgi:hypothetical protein